MNVLRQFRAFLAKGTHADPVDGDEKIFSIEDVLRKMVLLVGDGQFVTQEFSLAASGGTHTGKLPVNHSTAQNSQILVITNGPIKFTTVSPDLGTSNVIIQGSSAHKGILCFNQRTTSFSFTNDNATDDALVKYVIFNQPDLTLPASFRGGKFTTGNR